MTDRYPYYNMEGEQITFGEWAEYYKDHGDGKDRRAVGKDHVGDVFVSTVLLGIDHSYHEEGPPIIFETMVFGYEPHTVDEHEYQWRYATKEKALAGHAAILEAVRTGELTPDWELP